MKHQLTFFHMTMYRDFMIDAGSVAALVSVDRDGSVTAAARSLGYTPSAVSQQVKRLEAAVGVPLLERVGRGVVLTGAGRVLVDRAAPLLAELESAVSGAGAVDGRIAGTLRLAAFSTAVRGCVAAALERVAERWPRLRVELIEVDPWDASDLVATGRADLAVLHTWRTMPTAFPDHLRVDRVATDVADLVVPAEHPLADHTLAHPDDLLDCEWVSVAEGSICHEWLRTMFATVDAVPRIRYRSAEFATHVALVEAGLAVALLPRLGRGTLPPGCVAVPVVDPVPTREIHLACRRSRADHPAVAAVRGELAIAMETTGSA